MDGRSSSTAAIALSFVPDHDEDGPLGLLGRLTALCWLRHSGS